MAARTMSLSSCKYSEMKLAHLKGFAAAYEWMSIVYSISHEPELAAENIRKAYELRRR
jgi:hypothetical protein